MGAAAARFVHIDKVRATADALVAAGETDEAIEYLLHQLLSTEIDRRRLLRKHPRADQRAREPESARVALSAPRRRADPATRGPGRSGGRPSGRRRRGRAPGR